MLNPKQSRFVAEYLIDLNATQAAIRAGYSARTAKAQGARLLTHVDVQAALSKAQEKRAQRTEITQDRVLAEIAKVAFADVRKVFSPDGALIPIADLPDDAAAAIAGADIVTVNKGGGEVEYVAKIKMADKLRALELAGKHLGIFRERVELSGPNGGPIQAEHRDLSQLSDNELRALAGEHLRGED